MAAVRCRVQAKRLAPTGSSSRPALPNQPQESIVTMAPTKTKTAKSKAPKTKELAVGDKAPAFDLPADGGERISLAAFKGKSVVLYFYPKDDTSGCTAEAIAFTQAAKAFKAAGAVIVGVSKDSTESHDKFKSKHKLSLTLASDEDIETAQAYGVWVEKSAYGRRYMGMERATFLIDGKGVIRALWRKVKVPGHAAAVLQAVKTL
jgi:peroxiredoxin Q/BCP